jgi:hypothetical protein
MRVTHDDMKTFHCPYYTQKHIFAYRNLERVLRSAFLSLSHREHNSYKGRMAMDLGTVKFGLGIAAVVLVSIFASFALYWKIGEAALQKTRKKQEHH